MPTITVGSGQTYATRQIAWDTLSGSDQGGTVIAQLYGNDTSTFTASGVAANNWEFEDNTTVYDFTATTEDLLPVLNATTIQSENVTFRNVLFQPSNNFVVALTISADNTVIENYRLIAGTSANGRAVTTVQPNTFIRNGVESGGVDVAAVGFSDGCNINNVVKFGGSDKGAEGAGSVGVHFITDCFSFGNGGQDIDASVFTVTTTATEDVSGGTISGYTSAELVNFAGRDYRTKSASFLATAGTGGSFIGAAIEASSGISIAVTEVGPSFTESINTNLSVNITGAIVENGPSFTEAVNVTLTSLTLQANITETGPAFTESITATLTETLTINADITEQGPSFTESISVSLGVNITSVITELGPSFTESINISVIGDRVASIIESGPSFVESIIASIPITITVNPKNIIRVKRKDNTVIIKRKSNIIRVR